MQRPSYLLGRTGLFAVAMLAATSLAVGQQQNRQQQQKTQRPGQLQQQEQQRRVTANRPVASHERSTDQTIAQCLALENQEEIALARMASKSKDQKVREFAETLIKDHNNQLTQLQRFAGQIAQLEEPSGRQLADKSSTTQQTTAERDQAQQQRADTQRLGQQGQGHRFDFVEVKREIAEQCLANARREWNEKESGDAELCYLGGQVVAHQKMIDAQKVLRQYASAELQPVIDKGMEAAQTHLEHAKKLFDSYVSDARKSDKKQRDDNS